MQIIDPTYITDARLISCDISETEIYPEWSAATSYVTGQRVVITTAGIHKIYEAMWGTNNINFYPPANLTGTTIWWMKVSATNRWKLFDLIVAPDRAVASNNVQGCNWETGTIWQSDTTWMTITSSSIQVTILPGLIDTIALMNVDCTSISIVIRDAGTEVYNETKTPSVPTAFNAIYSDLPAYPNATLEITVKNADTAVSIGELIVGSAREVGTVRHGVGVGIVDYSKKEKDPFGNFSILERAFSKRIDCRFMMPVNTHSGVLRLLEKYRSIPLVWIISDQYSTTIAYGFYRDLKVSIPNITLAEGSVSIEGLGADYVHAVPPPDVWVEPWDGNIHLAGPIPVIAVSTSKIEETPVSILLPGLTGFIPTLAISTNITTFTDDGEITISIDSPCVVTLASHGLLEDRMIRFSTSGTLPTGLLIGMSEPNTNYYVKNPTLDSFNVSATIDGIAVNTSGSQSGVHHLWTVDL